MNTDILDTLTLQQFRSFCSVVDLGGYAAAARESGLSVPTVWGHVQQLEQQYKTPLFARSGRGVLPTDAGRRLYNEARPLLAAFAATIDAVRDRPAAPAPLTVLTGVRMTLEDLGPALKRFRDAYPEVLLRLLHGDNRKAADLLTAGTADLALALDPGPGMRVDGVHGERAFRLEYLAFIPDGHPLATKSRLGLSDLVAHPLVLGSRDTYGRLLLEQALHRNELADHLRVSVETDNSAYTIACVRAGLGIGVLAGRADGELGRGLTVRSLEPLLGQAWIMFLWMADRRLTTTQRAFVDIVRAELTKRPKLKVTRLGRA